MITLSLPLPPSINRTYKRGPGSFYKSDEAKAWEEESLWTLKKQWKKTPLACDVSLIITFYFANKRRDLSSGLKILEDVLEKGGIYKNDRQIRTEMIYKKYDKDNPRVEIRVVEFHE